MGRCPDLVGADIAIVFYVDGVLQSSATAPNTGGKGKPVKCIWKNFGLHDYYRIIVICAHSGNLLEIMHASVVFLRVMKLMAYGWPLDGCATWQGWDDQHTMVGK